MSLKDIYKIISYLLKWQIFRIKIYLQHCLGDSFPPHAVTDWHTHPVINAGIVISGQLTIVCRDGEEHTFHAGDALCEISNRVHRGENRSDLPADIVVFYASTPGAILVENSK